MKDTLALEIALFKERQEELENKSNGKTISFLMKAKSTDSSIHVRSVRKFSNRSGNTHAPFQTSEQRPRKDYATLHYYALQTTF